MFFAIALNTFREAVRDKILYVLAGFGLALILAARAVGWVSYGGESKITTDLGLASIWLFSSLISIFIGTGMIYKEIDKRTLYTILSKPINRWEFVVGKYAGLLLTSTVSLVLLSVVFLGYLKITGAPVTWALPHALLMTLFELALLNALAIFFSAASTPVLSAIFTFALFALGQLTKWVVEMGILGRGNPVIGKLMMGLYLFMPNLHNFNVRREAVEAAENGLNLAIPLDQSWSTAVYGISYTSVVLLAAIFMFRRRNF
jgi:ABC-type transport system involved in multi-copper enzyme maturation permease subunit